MAATDDLTAASPWMSGLSTLLQGLGQQMQGSGFEQHGYLQKTAADFTAAQLLQRGQSDMASSERAAVLTGMNADLVTSRQLAVAAASGGGASDPTVMNLIARTKGLEAYKQATQIYAGVNEQRLAEMQASAEQFSGAQEKAQGQKAGIFGGIQGVATALRGGVSLFEKFGRGGPPAMPSGDQGFESSEFN